MEKRVSKEDYQFTDRDRHAQFISIMSRRGLSPGCPGWEASYPEAEDQRHRKSLFSSNENSSSTVANGKDCPFKSGNTVNATIWLLLLVPCTQT